MCALGFITNDAFFAGASTSGTKSNLGPYTVKLVRQSIPLHSEDGIVQFKSAYHGRISVGSPELQHMDVVFDTGSGHLVLPSTICRSPTCTNHVRYKRKASLLSVDIDADGTKVEPGQPRDQITVSYGTGEVSGIFVRDQVCLGFKQPPKPAAPANSVQASSLLQTNANLSHSAGANLTESDDEMVDADMVHGCTIVQFVAATEMTEDPFASFAFDGVLGLGLSGLSQTPKFNFMEVASKSTAWTPMPGFDLTFSVFLGVSEAETSSITFGGYKPENAKPNAEFAWHRVVDHEHGYWQIEVFGIKANGQHVPYCDDGTCRAIVDTGTSLLGVPSDLGPLLVEHLRHANQKGYHCDATDEMGPVLEIQLANTTLVLGPSDISRPEFMSDVTAPPDENGVTLGGMDASAEAEDAGADAKFCVPMLMHLDLGDPLNRKTMILGEPVLQKYYAAFNMDSYAPRVGFTPAQHVFAKERLQMLK